ncbi:DNA-binding response regulator [Stenotrophomonas sp. ZAC14D2_NAIMI4_7]|uniref:response regulator n=1 Tax=Stenotrophomonas sp. ZAC14D2_NAIMI4_7 TaxID=2072405 RepID=UPI000D53C582|nr:response regulator transcription factor [Stenotrophomonas sp. ZAC14D2_NAIMI4_7]AWH15845.1 DNA-binding response regulator [Stenotrophomonas sp. ZAC14D2_NAIMI4_7]
MTDNAAATARILIVDDDPEIGALLAEYLGRHGLHTDTAAEGMAMWAALDRQRFDAVVLDLMLPGEDGLALCQQLRARTALPVIMLTARGRAADRILGLEHGADDYVAKPFDPRELLLRLQAVLRRAQPAALATRLRFAGWTLDTRTHQLQADDGRRHLLGETDFIALQLFLRHPDEVLERDYLVEQVYGRDRLPSDRSIDMCISRLRQMLEHDSRAPLLIRTVRHRGYCLAGPVLADG